MWAYGTHLLKLHGGHWTSALPLCSFRCAQSHKGSWLPSPRQGPGEMWKAPTGNGICFNSAKPSHQVQVGLQPNSHVGTSSPSPPTHSGRGGLEADVAGQQRSQLAICLCMDEWHHGPCTFVQGGAHWHYNWRLTYYECLQPPGPVTGVKATAMGRLGGLPWGLNGSLKALLFDFKELPLWNAANADEPTQDLPLIDVDWSIVEPKVPPSTRVEDPLRLNLGGELGQLQWASSATPSSPSQSITSRTQPPSAALGAPSPVGETENSPRSMGTEHIIPAPAVTLPQTSPQATPPSSSPGSAHSTQQLFQLTGPRTPETGSMPYIKWPPASSEGKLTSLSKELFHLQEEMNTDIEELLEVRASLDYCHRELDLGAELAAHHNDAQLTKAKTHHTAASTALQWAHLDSISALNCEVMTEEGSKC